MALHLKTKTTNSRKISESFSYLYRFYRDGGWMWRMPNELSHILKAIGLLKKKNDYQYEE